MTVKKCRISWTRLSRKTGNRGSARWVRGNSTARRRVPLPVVNVRLGKFHEWIVRRGYGRPDPCFSVNMKRWISMFLGSCIFMICVLLSTGLSEPSILYGKGISSGRGFALVDQGIEEAGQQEKEKASGLLQRFQDYWGHGDVVSLMSLLSERARVIMKIDFLGLDGEYGRGQADYIMKEFFGRAQGNRFSISRYRELSGGVSAYAAGNIVYTEKKSGVTRELLIFISLEERGGEWSIQELRISEE